MTTNLGIPSESLKTSISQLELALANEVVLYTKTRKFHWNVVGNSFMELHKLFENQYTELEEVIDAIAERINTLGAKTIGTMTEFLGLTSLKEHPNVYPSQSEMLTELLADHETIIGVLRKDIKKSESLSDVGTTDFLTGLLQQHEKTAWILRRYLTK